MNVVPSWKRPWSRTSVVGGCTVFERVEDVP